MGKITGYSCPNCMRDRMTEVHSQGNAFLGWHCEGCGASFGISDPCITCKITGPADEKRRYRSHLTPCAACGVLHCSTIDRCPECKIEAYRNCSVCKTRFGVPHKQLVKEASRGPRGREVPVRAACSKTCLARERALKMWVERALKAQQSLLVRRTAPVEHLRELAKQYREARRAIDRLDPAGVSTPVLDAEFTLDRNYGRKMADLEAA